MEEQAGQATDRADLRSAVLWVTAPESHGTQFGEVPTLSAPNEAATFVAERVQGGADYIKVIYDHLYSVAIQQIWQIMVRSGGLSIEILQEWHR